MVRCISFTRKCIYRKKRGKLKIYEELRNTKEILESNQMMELLKIYFQLALNWTY